MRAYDERSTMDNVTPDVNTLKVFGWVWLAVVILIILFEEVKGIRPKGGAQEA